MDLQIHSKTDDEIELEKTRVGVADAITRYEMAWSTYRTEAEKELHERLGVKHYSAEDDSAAFNAWAEVMRAFEELIKARAAYGALMYATNGA